MKKQDIWVMEQDFICHYLMEKLNFGVEEFRGGLVDSQGIDDALERTRPPSLEEGK